MNHHKLIEKFLGRKISDATYYRIKSALFNAKLPLNKENLMIICELKKISKKHRVQLQIIINYYLEISNIDFKISGKNLYLYLVKITNFKPHRTTIIRSQMNIPQMIDRLVNIIIKRIYIMFSLFF